MEENYRSCSQEHVYNTSEIAWQRVFEETAEQGWKERRIWIEKDTLVI